MITAKQLFVLRFKQAAHSLSTTFGNWLYVFQQLRFHKEAGEELFRIAMHYDETWQYEQAVFWYRKAAELDHAAAQYHLGLC